MMSTRESIKRRVEALEAALRATTRSPYCVQFVFYEPGEEEDWSINVIEEPENGN
jgi:hypothetical protein